MTRFILLISFTTLFAVSAFAQNFDNGQTVGPAAGGDSRNMFEEINKAYNQIRQRGNGKKADEIKKMLDDNFNGPKGLVPKGAAAICPSCKQLCYRHSEPGFRCIPVDIDGNPMPMAEIIWRKIQCPVCQVQFLGAMPGNTNNKGGLDRDFCVHSIGKACVHSRVWTCPDCGYAALIDSFGSNWDKSVLSDETKTFVRTVVSPLMFVRMCKLAGIKEESITGRDAHNLRHFAEYVQQGDMQQDQIPDWIKYDNAIKIYKQQKAPSALMARLYLEAAYAGRRELNGEIAIPVLHSVLEESLSFSIRRIQHDLTAATIQIRRSHNQVSMIDPNRAEVDPQILCEASEMIMKMGEQTGDRIQEENVRRGERANADQFYTTGDMFVLCLRYAGFLDRLGRTEDADRALNKAKSFIPDNMTADLGDAGPEAAEYVGKQLKLIRDYVDDRKRCLQFENECLNRAMWENLVAIHAKQVAFADPTQLLTSNDASQMDPAMSAYMLGELARRCNEPGAGPAFLAAADAIVKSQFAQLDKEEATLLPLKESAPAKYAAGKEQIRKLNERAALLQTMIIDQRKLAKSGGKLDEKVKEVLDIVLKKAGIDPVNFKAPELPAESGTPEVNPLLAEETVKSAQGNERNIKADVPRGAANASGIKTREALYKMYFEAISKYVKDKKSNPPTLAALVETHYISAENSCLNEKGDLICPETKDVLQYTKGFKLDNKTDCVIFQSKNMQTAKLLFADGEVHAFGKGK